MFGIKDYWYRYEFQGRGSTHVHGFAWIDEAVAPEAFYELDDEAKRALFTALWKRHIYAINPEPGRQRAGRRTRGVYNLPSKDLQNTVEQLSDVVNRTQVHVCSDGYCQRRKKGAAADAPKECRFYFPRATGEADTNKVPPPNRSFPNRLSLIV
jgi:ATP-dependent DNA helicase PIF1